MMIKFITYPNNGIHSIDGCRLFTEVSDLCVIDCWLDAEARTDEGLPRATEADERVLIGHDFPQAVPTSQHPQQQYVQFLFNCHGKRYEVWTALPAYVMNDTGKTVESYRPILK